MNPTRRRRLLGVLSFLGFLRPRTRVGGGEATADSILIVQSDHVPGGALRLRDSPDFRLDDADN